nr:hypothetical protein MarFTME_042 [Marseillevirus futianmevirus]
MEAFLEKRELVSWSVNEEPHNIDPKKHVRTRTSTVTKSEGNFKTTSEDVLPDGTRHGKYKKTRDNNGEIKEVTANFKMGKLHGSFLSETIRFGETFFECRAQFRHGIPNEGIECSSLLFGKVIQRSYLSFRGGFPCSILWGEHIYPIMWGKNILSLGGENYKDVSFSDEGEDYEQAVLILGREFESFEKFSPKVYGTDKEGRRGRLYIPVFLAESKK